MQNMNKGNEKLAILLYFLLNIGIILRILFEPFYLSKNNFVKFFILISAILQFLAILIYVYLLWFRVKEKSK